MIAFLLLLTCHTFGCEGMKDNFIGEWWQVYIAENAIGSCLLFSEDGHVVQRHDDGVTAIMGTWELIDDENCEYTIRTTEEDGSQKELILLGWDESCWSVEYEGGEYLDCECIL